MQTFPSLRGAQRRGNPDFLAQSHKGTKKGAESFVALCEQSFADCFATLALTS
jgi:hypothetical protein